MFLLQGVLIKVIDFFFLNCGLSDFCDGRQAVQAKVSTRRGGGGVSVCLCVGEGGGGVPRLQHLIPFFPFREK